MEINKHIICFPSPQRLLFKNDLVPTQRVNSFLDRKWLHMKLKLSKLFLLLLQIQVFFKRKLGNKHFPFSEQEIHVQGKSQRVISVKLVGKKIRLVYPIPPSERMKLESFLHLQDTGEAGEESNKKHW